MLAPIYEDLAELPFAFDGHGLPDLEPDLVDLLRDGHTNTAFPVDGLVDFFAIRICTSNARLTAKFFELVLGFEEVAYRGLETSSTKIASHVLRNGSVTIELTNTLSLDEPEVHTWLHHLVDMTDLRKSLLAGSLENVFVSAVGNHYQQLMADEEAAARAQAALQLASFFRDFCRGPRTEALVENLLAKTSQLVLDMINCHLIQKFVSRHGDGVSDIMLTVIDVRATFARAVANGAQIIAAPHVFQDTFGSVVAATILVPSTDICHTIVQNINYAGAFLPGYMPPPPKDPLHQAVLDRLPPVRLAHIDHCVQNYTWHQMMQQAWVYAKVFGLHKFWSVDEQDVSTTNSALRSIVMALGNGRIKIPINEPAEGRMKSQIEEFHDFNGGPGVQHVALRTYDIIGCVVALKQRGIQFNTISNEYYANLSTRLAHDNITLQEDFDKLKQLHVLVDYDPSTKYKYKNRYRCNYILQIFTKPLHDRPTLFFEIIQRHHHNGFGKGTFKGLFESIEEQQKQRGTLTPVNK